MVFRAYNPGFIRQVMVEETLTATALVATYGARTALSELSAASRELYDKTYGELFNITEGHITEEELHQLSWLAVIITDYDGRCFGRTPEKRVEIDEAEVMRKAREFLIDRLGQLRKEAGRGEREISKLKEVLSERGGKYSKVLEMKIGDAERRVTERVDVPEGPVDIMGGGENGGSG